MTGRRLPSLSYRARILLVVFGVGVAPVALLGLWLVAGTARTGENLLRGRLREALIEERAAVEAGWVPTRSALLDYADSPDVRRALLEPADPEASPGAAPAPPPGTDVATVRVRDAAGRIRLLLGTPDLAGEGEAPGGLLPVEIPIHDRWSGEERGRLRAMVPFLSLRRPTAATLLAGGVITAADPATGTLLLPVPFPPDLLGRRSFEWNGEPWVVERVRLSEPAVDLMAAAPLTPFTAPFHHAARWGATLLLAVALAGLALAAWLTGRLTSSLHRVTEAAEAVSEGDLDRVVPASRDDEVGRLAAAFNRMTRSLRETLDALAGRESLEAVNEFAASLAHEVRNPLTAIRLDLQEVEESLPPSSPLREIQGRALDDLGRLNRAVEGALETARSGRVRLEPLDLLGAIERGIRGAEPLAREHGVRIEPPGESRPVRIRGDGEALERVVLNLVLNAVEASPIGSSVSVEAHAEDGGAVLGVLDRGEGIPEEDRARVLEPFFTTRAGGTGIGLAVSRRIVAAHGGSLEIRRREGGGTEVRVLLPSGAPGSRPAGDAEGAGGSRPGGTIRSDPPPEGGTIHSGPAASDPVVEIV